MLSLTNLRAIWANIPGVTYSKERKAPEPKPNANPQKAKRKRRSRRDYEHPLFKENPVIFTKYGRRRQIPLTPEPSSLEWCSAKEAMGILNCCRTSVDAIAKKYSIPTQRYSKVRPNGKGATAFTYYLREEVIMASKLRRMKKSKSKKHTLMEDVYIPTADACLLLNVSVNPAILHYHNIPHKKEFTSLYWSRNAIYKLLKERRLASSAPKNYLTTQDVAEKLGRTENVAVYLLKKEKVPCISFRKWNGRCYRNTKIYHVKAVNKLIAKLRFERNSFPPEGWLESKDVTAFLHLSYQQARKVCIANNVRIKAITPHKYLYNEDDVVALRRARNRAKNQFKHNS